MRKRPDPYQWVIDEYPPTITKDQLYRICHISKRTASHLLENLTPNDYTAPKNWYGCKVKKTNKKKPFRSVGTMAST